jgi:hypothetical protein
MNVWVMTPHSLPAAIGGVARVSGDTPEGPCARGHNVAVRARCPEGKPAMANTRGVTICRGLRRSVLPHTLSDMYEIWRARRRALADSSDVILAHGGAAAAAMLTVARRAPAVCVLTRVPLRSAKTALMRVLFNGRDALRGDQGRRPGGGLGLRSLARDRVAIGLRRTRFDAKRDRASVESPIRTGRQT